MADPILRLEKVCKAYNVGLPTETDVLHDVDLQLDHGEFLDVFAATPEQLLGWCRDGTVTDAKTLTCTVWLQNVLSGAWTLDWSAGEGAAAAG